MQGLISIIIPVYQAENYLEECIKSVLAQTYVNIEIILVNDGSTDKSGAICDKYALLDNRIIVIHQENLGVTQTRKNAFLASKGEYIGFVDADDWIDTNMYQHLYDMMQEHQVEFVQSGILFEGEVHARTLECGRVGRYINKSSVTNCSYRYMHNSDSRSVAKISPHLWNKLFRREVLEQFLLVVPPEIRWGEDRACVYAAVPFIDSIYITDMASYHYRQHGASAVHLEQQLGEQSLNSLNLFYHHLCNLFETHQDKQLLLAELNEYYKVKFVAALKNLLPQAIHIRYTDYEIPMRKLSGVNRIVVYGAGNVGQSYIQQLETMENMELVAIVDKMKCGTQYKGYQIVEPKDIVNLNYDKIMIAVLREEIANQIKTELMNEYKIEEQELLWCQPLTGTDQLFSKS